MAAFEVTPEVENRRVGAGPLQVAEIISVIEQLSATERNLY
jgi:hypothetical protein